MNDVAIDPNARIFAYQRELAKLPPAYAEIEHIFLPGIYIREARLPAGASFTGMVHLHDHASFVDGDITVVSKDGEQRITGSGMVIATAGTKRAVLVHAPTTWRTVHPNPTEERDIAKLDAMFVLPETTPEVVAYALQGVLS